MGRTCDLFKRHLNHYKKKKTQKRFSGHLRAVEISCEHNSVLGYVWSSEFIYVLTKIFLSKQPAVTLYKSLIVTVFKLRLLTRNKKNVFICIKMYFQYSPEHFYFLKTLFSWVRYTVTNDFTVVVFFFSLMSLFELRFWSLPSSSVSSVTKRLLLPLFCLVIMK